MSTPPEDPLDCTPQSLGEAIINAFISGGLNNTEIICDEAGTPKGTLTTWSAGAAEQLEAVVADWQEKHPA